MPQSFTGGLSLGLFSAVLLLSASASSQPQPELTIGTRSIASVAAELSAGADSQGGALGVVDFSDTSVMLRGRLQLFPEFRGGSVVGFQFPDADSDLGVVFFHQAYLFLEGRHFDVKIGRSRVQSSIVEFPTVRDDDLLPFTDTPNQFSSGTTTEDHQYGNVLEFTGILSSKFFLSAHAEHMFLSPGDQGSRDFTLNSFGSTLRYRNIPARINAGVIRELGVGVNYNDAKDDGLPATWTAIAGGALNIFPDPIHLFDARIQGIYNHGDEDTELSNANSTYRARSFRGAAALRYMFSDGSVPTMQVAIVAGYTRYIDNADASSMSGIVNGFYNLGYGFDVGVQYQMSHDSAGVRQALGTPELAHTQQAIMRFGYELSANPLPERDSILNVEHGYIP
ncbi:hypothetical protein JYT22_01185 [Endomicrobium sp. AH-315-J14]|nr:hypothetical protein [Endomicrobium sp. AH-315-J14]